MDSYADLAGTRRSSSECTRGQQLGDNDSDLLLAARQGCKRALGRLLELEQAWLRGVLRRECGSASTNALSLDDLVQECFLRCLKSSSSPKSRSMAEFRGWILHASCNLLREGHRQRRMVSIDDERAHAEPLLKNPGREGPLQAHLVSEALSALPTPQVASIIMKDFCGCDYKTIAWVMGEAKVEQAYSLHRRALEAIRSEIADRLRGA